MKPPLPWEVSGCASAICFSFYGIILRWRRLFDFMIFLTMYLTNMTIESRIFFYISLVLTKHMFKNLHIFSFFKAVEYYNFYNDNEKRTRLCKNVVCYPIFPWKLKDLKQFLGSNARRNKLSQSIYRETCETESYEIKGLWLVLVLLTFFESWKIFLVNVVTISMMSAKVAALSLLKVKAFWSHKFCPWRHQQNLPCDSNYTADTAMRPKFSKCSISMREVTITSVLHRFHQKSQFFEG